MFTDAQGEVTRGIDIVEFAAAHRSCSGATTPTGVHRHRQLDAAPATGVVAGASRRLTFPSWCRCGCTLAHGLRQYLCAQTQPHRPSASLLMARLLQEAGLPNGAFNVVRGDKDAVDALLVHQDVKAVSFSAPRRLPIHL